MIDNPTIFRSVCRIDSRGLFELPPGESSCLVYVNGPAAAVGVLAASGFAGVTSALGTMAGGMSMAMMVTSSMPRETRSQCPGNLCLRDGRCCRRIRGFCPLRC